MSRTAHGDVGALAIHCQREASSPELPPLVPRAAIPPESVPEAMLAAVAGVSTVTARALLERLGSVTAVASHDVLLEVPGIGPERARALALALRGAE